MKKHGEDDDDLMNSFNFNQSSIEDEENEEMKQKIQFALIPY